MSDPELPIRSPTSDTDIGNSSIENSARKGAFSTFGNNGLKEVIPVEIGISDLWVSVDTTTTAAKIKKKLFGSCSKSKSAELELVDLPTSSSSEAPKSNILKVLKDVTGVKVKSGQLLAILGTSGSGKTTLLNSIAGRLDPNMTIDGTITFNGYDVTNSKKVIRNNVGYVMQTDHLLPNLTVRETLRYAALLRLPDSIPRKEKLQLVEEVIAELGLRDCSSTYIGGNGRRGISGGEKRRVSIGVQMLTNPSVLLLDEPTSGLDSFTAHNLMETLLTLARSGRTVICTIHQPRTDIFHLFDLVMLLSKGHLVYYGRAKHMISYFSSAGFECPLHANPADYFLDLITVDNRNDEANKTTRDRLDVLVKSFKERKFDYTQRKPVPIDNINKEENPKSLVQRGSKRRSKKEFVSTNNGQTPLKTIRGGASMFNQSWILLGRSIKNILRDRVTFMSRFIEVLIMALLAGGIFYKMDSSFAGIRSRQAFFYVMSTLQPYLIMVATIMQYSRELLIFDREYYDGMFSVVPYWIATKLSMLPLDILTPIVFTSIVYYMSGIDPAFTKFLWFNLIVIAIQYLSTSVGFMASCFIRDFAGASLLCNVFVAFWSYSSGFLLNPASFPPYLEIIQYTSFFQYGFAAMSINEFKGKMYDCPLPAESPECDLYRGDRIISNLELTNTNVGVNVAIVFGLAIGVNILALIGLRFIKQKPK